MSLSNNGFTAHLAGQYGLSVNQHNRVYQNGRALTLEQKILIASSYLQAKSEANGSRPNIQHLADQCRVSRSTVTKIEEELMQYGRVRSPEEIRNTRDAPAGPGSIVLDDTCIFIILRLYYAEPSRTLKSYVIELVRYTGVIVHESTISRFFNHGFPIKGRLCTASNIPIDKFRPENLERAIEYLLFVSLHERWRLKFGDQKHMKGAELYCRKTRRDVFTGIIPPVMTSSDFWNTYSIVGFCGIDVRVTPLRYSISSDINDATNFAIQIEIAIICGWLIPFDVLVLDRAAIHTGGENECLEDWCWDNFCITILFLPARTCEWNPIELVWNILVQRLNVFSLSVANSLGKHSLVKAAMIVLDGITHTEVDGSYRKCGY